LTSGGPPQLVFSFAALNQAFRGAANSYISAVGPPYALAVHDNRIYLSKGFGTNPALFSGTFVYDLHTQDLAYWDVSPVSFMQLATVAGTRPKLCFVGVTGVTISSNQVLYFDETALTDNGTVFQAWYRSGFWNPGKPGSETVIREWLVDGKGTVGFRVGVNDSLNTNPLKTLTLGTADSIVSGNAIPGTVGQDRDRRAVRGRNFFVEFFTPIAGFGPPYAPWQISRLTALVRIQSQPGAES
jgi:hypothetical protein